jgi:hypothetical protein
MVGVGPFTKQVAGRFGNFGIENSDAGELPRIVQQTYYYWRW